MRILAVDTSSERGSVCVADDRDILGEVRIASSIQHSERLFRSIEFLFQYLPFRLSDIEFYVAARGPGSFTGLRIGLAAMEGFVASHVGKGGGVSTLAALAWKMGLQNVTLAPTIDARRGEVFGGLYRRVADRLIEERPPVVLKPAQWFESLPRTTVFFSGDGAVRYRAGIDDVAGWSLHSTDLYLASSIAEMAATSNCGPLEPLYVRRTDAEIARDIREGKPGT